MSWEAFRLTSKSPAELYTVLGPHAVDELIRHAMNSCWRQVPEEQRSFQSALKLVHDIFDRNWKIWLKIKKPAPEAYFADLGTAEADGLFRQAFVLSWMMLPRKGGRKFSDTHKVIQDIYQRNLAAWTEDNVTFTKGVSKRKAVSKKPPAKSSKPRAAAPRKRR